MKPMWNVRESYSRFMAWAHGGVAKAAPLLMPFTDSTAGFQNSTPPTTVRAAGSLPIQKASKGVEIGVSGLAASHGYLFEEFLPQLQGEQGRRMFREMSDNDDTIGAMLYALETLLKAADWNVEAAEGDTTGEYADFLKSNMDDMEHTWTDFISEVLTEFVFGFSFFEKVFKRRVGPFEVDPTRRSKHTDGKIGIRKLAPRAQESLQRWEMDPNGDVIAFIQQPLYYAATNTIGTAGPYTIPMGKGLLFRTTSKKNNPEGRSLLRNAYVSYFHKKNIQFTEATGIERNLAGMPVVSIPASYLNISPTDPDFAQKSMVLATYKKIARDLKFNEQGAIVIPSDTFKDTQGNPTAVKMVEVQLLSASGSKNVDTNTVVLRYSNGILRSILSDWMMLGNDSKGSHALSSNKTEVYFKSAQGYLDAIADVLNRVLVTDLWQLNGFPIELMPHFAPGQIAPEDLEKFGTYIEQLAHAGFTLAGDPETERVVRQKAGLPEEVDPNILPRDLVFQQEQADQAAQNAAMLAENDAKNRAQMAGQKQPPGKPPGKGPKKPAGK